MGEQMFFVIETESQSGRSFSPCEGEKNYRFISSESDLTNAIDKLGKDPGDLSYESKKDRIHHYKAQARIQELTSVITSINELNSIEDKGSLEVQILKKLIETLCLEYSVVMGKNIDVSKELIATQLLGENNE